MSSETSSKMDHTNHLHPGLWLNCWLGKPGNLKQAVNLNHLSASSGKERALPTWSLLTAGGVTEWKVRGERKDAECFMGTDKDVREAEAKERTVWNQSHAPQPRVRQAASSGSGKDVSGDGLGSETNTDLCRWSAKTNFVSRPYLYFEESGSLDVAELHLKTEEWTF